MREIFSKSTIKIQINIFAVDRVILGVVFVHGDIIEKLTRPLDHKQVLVNFNVFYVTFNCETVDFD